MNRTRFYVPIIAVFALSVALITQPVTRAFAHHVTLTASTTCGPNGWSVLWTVTNSESNKTMDITNHGALPGLFSPDPVGFSGSAIKTTQHAFNVASVSLTVTADWIQADPDSDSRSVNRPANCPPSTATPTQTATATATATKTSTPTWTPTATPIATLTVTPPLTATPIITITSTPTAIPSVTVTNTPTATSSITPIPTATSTLTPFPTPFQFQSQGCEGAFWTVRLNGLVVSQAFAPGCLPPQAPPLPPVQPPAVIPPPVVIQPPIVITSPPVVISSVVITPPRLGSAGLASE